MLLQTMLKPEYFYQPRIALRRLLKPNSEPDTEFVQEKFPWGLSIRFRPQEEHGRILSALGVIDLAVTETLWRLADPGELAVDIGANIGCMTAALAARVGTLLGGTVWAFEAHPQVFEELKHNIEQWQRQTTVQFEAHQLAVSDRQRSVKLSTPNSFETNRGLAFVVASEAAQDSGSSETIVVKSECLDALLPSAQIGVLKIDVEGHELAVLRGAIGLLKAKRIRDCVFEEHGNYPTEATNFLEDAGYTLFRIHRSFFKPLLLAPDSKVARSRWQPTSFLATCEPDRVSDRLRTPDGNVSAVSRPHIFDY